MEICGEHGEDMAFIAINGKYTCPACSQIEDINDDKQEIIDGLMKEVEELNEKIWKMEQEEA